MDTNYKNWHLEHANAWKIMPSPARPSKEEVKIFKKYIFNYINSTSKKVHLLILGSTPEFRDLCNEPRINATCIDINKPIYEALTILQKKPNINEKFINDNWLTFRNKQKFELIIGDAVTAMFPLKLYSEFFENMKRHLAKKGQLIIRVPYQDERFNVSIKKVFENYKKKFKSCGINIYTATYNYLVMNYLDESQSSISLNGLWEKIKELYLRDLISRKECIELEKYYKNLTLKLFYPKEEYIFSSSIKYLKFVAKEFSLDYISSYCNPVFIFGRQD